MSAMLYCLEALKLTQVKHPLERSHETGTIYEFIETRNSLIVYKCV